VKLSDYSFRFCLAALLAVQVFAGLWHLGDPFYDGRYHYNWGPPFWLIRAHETNDAGLAASYFGVAGYHSHPQLIGPVIALWTRAMGYSESSIRSLALLMAVIATCLLALWVRRYAGTIAALATAALFAVLPIIYMFGKKLDQENLLIIFLLMQLIGYSIVRSRKRMGLVVIGLSSFLMMSSDWSGVIFAAALFASAVVAWGWREHRSLFRRVAFISGAGVAIALLLFIAQSYAQDKVASAGKFFGDYYQVWLYRAGQSSNLPWYWWPYRQFYFLSDNFSIPLFLIAMGGLIAGLRSRLVGDTEKELVIFGVAVFLGSLAYQLAVPQASGVHIYYQFYYAIPVAIGLYMAAHIYAASYLRAWRGGLLVLVGLMFLGSAAWTAHTYYTFIHVNQSGDRSDIALLQSLREIPPDLEIVAGATTDLGQNWFQNPNIRYYAGRDIPAYVMKSGMPLAPYQIIPIFTAKDYLSTVNVKHGYGTRVSATILYCSTDYCLVNLIINKR
jgi:4-amino-4-deoxy-L-arabinose transferase-like glycosyltransferase